LVEHEAILAALLERDTERAVQAMEQHIQHSKENVLKYLAIKPRPVVRTMRALDVPESKLKIVDE
jgi:DNA-binding GntR family transcriptional regulator